MFKLIGMVIDLIKRARAHEALTPGQRALLKFFKSLFLSMIVSVLAVLAQSLVLGHLVDASLFLALGLSAAYSGLAGIAKFFGALGEPVLVQAAQAGTAEVVKRYPNEAGHPPITVAEPNAEYMAQFEAEAAEINAELNPPPVA